MTDTNKTTETNTAVEKQPSDARIILGPLAKYAAVGLVLVGIIITTAIMLDKQLNNIDREMAALEAELAEANEKARKDAANADQGKTTTEVAAVKPQETKVKAAEVVTATAEVARTDKIATAPAQVKEVAKTAVVAKTEVPAVAEIAKEAAPVATEQTFSQVDDADSFEQSIEEVIAERNAYIEKLIEQREASIEAMIAEQNAYMKERDRVYLEELKAGQAQKLEKMREQLARQEQRIIEMEQRQKEIYELRAASIKEMQQMREEVFTGRI